MKTSTLSGLLVTCLLLFAGTLATAQNLRVTTSSFGNLTQTDSLYFTPDEYLNYVFGNLNLSGLSTGRLIEKSSGGFVRENYDGINGNDAIVNGRSCWFRLYSAIQSSAVNANAINMPQPSDLQSFAEDHLQNALVPIAVVNAKYQFIRQEAITAGLLNTDAGHTRFYDNPNSPYSPYDVSRLFINCAYYSGTSYHSNGEVRFIIPDNLFIRDVAIGQLQADFGDGMGYRSFNIGTPVTVQYASSGVKYIKIKAGDLESTSEFNFTKYETFSPGEPIVYVSENSSNQKSASSTMNTSSIVPQAYYQTFIGCDRILNKPILIVEGLAIQENESPAVIFQRYNYPYTSNAMLTRLQDLGYDIVVVKFTQNGASVFDNAKALKAVIQNINQTKIGSEKLHIIGESMGGLITKYCLKSMENGGLPHNVQNFISFDAPHQGANVPVGFQHVFTHAGRISKSTRNDPEYKQVLEVLQSTAAKQLLINNIFDDTGVRANFVATYNSQGYPTLTNNYAITNGRLDGVGLNFSNGAQLLSIQGDRGSLFHLTQRYFALNTSPSEVAYSKQSGIGTWILVNLFTGLTNSSLKVSGYSSAVFEPVPGSTNNAPLFYAQSVEQAFKENSVTNNGISLFGRDATCFVPSVSALDISTSDPYYNIASGNVVANHITPFQDIISSNANVDHLTLNYDIANFMISKIVGGNAPSYGCNDLCNNTPSFTPTAAFCQYTEQEVTINNFPSGVTIQWNLPWYVTLISGQGTSKIRIISNQSGNISLSVTVGRPGCTSITYPVNLSVTGVATPMLSRTQNKDECTYATIIANAPGATSFEWVTTGDVLINCSQTSLTTGSSQISICGSFGGTIKVRAYYNNGCVPSPFAEMCFVGCNNGNGYPNTVQITNSSPLPNEPMSCDAQSVGNATGYKWYIDNTYYETTAYPHWDISSWPCGDHNIFCLAETECGDSYSASGSYWGLCPGSYFSFYPNPANNQVTITSKASEYHPSDKAKRQSAAVSGTPFKFKIIDRFGRVLIQATSPSGEDVRTEVSNIISGTYFLHIDTGKEIIKKQLIIQH